MEKRNFFATFFVFLVVSLFIFLIGTSGVLGPVGSSLYKISEPVKSVLKFSGGQEKNEILARLEKLSDQAKLEREVKALRDQFDSGSLSSSTLLPARIIGSPTFIPGVTSPQLLILDKGEEDGVKKGMAAVVSNNLVGVVKDVSQGASSVILITNESFSTTASVGQALGVIKGEGGQEMILGNVALSYTLNKDDVVYSKGAVNEAGVGIPPDLVIGTIASVDKRQSDLFQQAKVRSSVNFETLSHVFLVLR